MIKHIAYKSLYKADHGWLQSRFHFSFAEYKNIDNIQYGPLRVMNDDLIKGNSGFPMHPHHDMEIITYILKGELTHQDSMGHKEILRRGDVQYMSAGTGITHSEMNESDEEVHLIQTWIIPQQKGLKPQYGSKRFDKEQRDNRWLHIVGAKESLAHIKIYQDASMYVSQIDAKRKLNFDLKDGRQAYVKVMEGRAKINDILFEQGDAAEVKDEDLNIEALEDAHLLLVEMKK